MVIDIGPRDAPAGDPAARDLAVTARGAVTRQEVIWLTEDGRRVAAIVPAAMVAACLKGA